MCPFQQSSFSLSISLSVSPSIGYRSVSSRSESQSEEWPASKSASAPPCEIHESSGMYLPCAGEALQIRMSSTWRASVYPCLGCAGRRLSRCSGWELCSTWKAPDRVRPPPTMLVVKLGGSTRGTMKVLPGDNTSGTKPRSSIQDQQPPAPANLPELHDLGMRIQSHRTFCRRSSSLFVSWAVDDW